MDHELSDWKFEKIVIYDINQSEFKNLIR